MKDEQRVFVVDDEPNVLRAISRLLRAEGIRHESFGSGREFMERYNPDVTGCLLIDISMPEITGLQVQQWLVNSGIPLPIIFLTGRGDSAERLEALRWGAVEVLMKPVAAKDLFRCIEEALVQNCNGK
jgi:FixJ family two-component response regulator